MDEKQLQELLKKYHQGTCTPGEMKLLDEWYASISAKSSFSDSVREHDAKKKAWARLASEIQQNDDQEVRRPRNFLRPLWPAMGIAASIIFIITLVVSLLNEGTPDNFFNNDEMERVSGRRYIQNKNAEPVSLSLPDGTQISLLPGGAISFSEQFASREREVFLDGEAFFDVAPDPNRPFLVVTAKLTTKVLGTSFLVRAYKRQSEALVIVKTGKVSVYTHTQQDSSSKYPVEEIILTPNQQVVFDSNERRTVKTLVDEPQVILPKPTLQYRHSNTGVTEIIRSLESNYGIDVSYDSALLANCTLTSDMSGAGFLEQIAIICNALGAEYRISGTTVIIEGATGCAAN